MGLLSGALSSGGGASPGKAGIGSTGGSVQEWFKAVGPKRTNNEMVDAQNRSLYAMISDMHDQFTQFPEDVPLVASEAKRIRLMRAKNESNSGITEVFTSFGKVRQLDEDILIQWVLAHSDLTTDDIMHMKAFDPESPHHLYCHATGLSMLFSLPEDMKIVAVFREWSTNRSEKLKNPLKAFKESGAILPSGQINWLDKTFALTWVDDVLSKVEHVASGITAEVNQKANISKAFDFKHFWAEVDAYLKLDPFPGVKLIGFYKNKTNPFGYPLGINRKDTRQAIEHEVKIIADRIRNDLKKVQGEAKDTQDRAAIKGQLEKIDADKKKNSMHAAREKALAAVAKKAAKRKLSM